MDSAIAQRSASTRSKAGGACRRGGRALCGAPQRCGFQALSL